LKITQKIKKLKFHKLWNFHWSGWKKVHRSTKSTHTVNL